MTEPKLKKQCLESNESSDKKYLYICTNPDGDSLGYAGDNIGFILNDLLGFLYPGISPLDPTTNLDSLDQKRRYFIIEDFNIEKVQADLKVGIVPEWLEKYREDKTMDLDNSEDGSEDLDMSEDSDESENLLRFWEKYYQMSDICEDCDCLATSLPDVSDVNKVALEALANYNLFQQKQNQPFLSEKDLATTCFMFSDATGFNTVNFYQLMKHLILYPPSRSSPLKLFC